MGLLILDHTQGQGIDGRQGTREEFDTLACKHCGRIIARLIRVAGNQIHHLANIDIGRAAPVIQDLGGDIDAKPTCAQCGGAFICRICAGLMEAKGGDCPGPFEARIENALQTGAPLWDPLFAHDYGKTSHAAKGAGF